MFLFWRKTTKKKEENVKSNRNQDQNRNQTIPKQYDAILGILKTTYSYPQNQDFVIRELEVASMKKKASLCYLDGMVDVQTLENQIIRPLMNKKEAEVQNLSDIGQKIVETLSVRIVTNLNDIIQAINEGDTALIVEGESEVLMLNTVGFKFRSVTQPTSEMVVRGPHEAFTEASNINRSLIRKTLRSEHLVSDNITVGKQTHSDISVLYMKNIVDPKLVSEVKQRIQQIDKDNLQEIGLLEQHIEERPYSLVPSVLTTERPDRVVSFLLEGHVAILHSSSSTALVVPATFWDLFHASEDSYLRWGYSFFIRSLRMMALFLALLFSPIYIAISNFHHEMLPTDLLFAIAGTREVVPFPAVVEIYLMEFSFELIREAGLRVPSPMGQMIGIVGALILGQAAVQANVISPILIIVVATGGVASFAIPSNSLGYMIRISKFVFLFFASTFGLLGLGLVIVLYLSYLVSIKSFGVPFLAPYAPNYKGSSDLVYRPPVWKEWLRPLHLNPINKQRAKQPKGNQRQ